MDLDPERWLTEHGDALFRFALLRTSRRDIAEDLVQETLLAAWRSRDGFRRDSSERTWLVGILKNKIRDHYRDQGQQENLATRIAADGEQDERDAARFPRRPAEVVGVDAELFAGHHLQRGVGVGEQSVGQTAGFVLR